MSVNQRLVFLEKNVPRTLLVLGIIGVIVSLFAPNPYARGLFVMIAAVPIIMGLLTYARLSRAQDEDAKTSKIIIEATWILLTFGLSYLVMAPSVYYNPGNAVVLAALIVIGIVQAVLGLYAMLSYSKEGYILTP